MISTRTGARSAVLGSSRPRPDRAARKGRTTTDPLGERFWSKVRKTDDCWLWTAGLNGGYGVYTIGGRPRPAHRLAYEELVGPVPDGLQLDHLCRVRRCVNPAHLEPVTSKENTRRGTAVDVIAERQRSKTHCPRGHPYAIYGITITRRTGSRAGRTERVCTACRKRRS
jgi:hypothetical protein